MTDIDDVVIARRASVLLELCAWHGLRIASAESCSGGSIAAALTDVPGASRVFECGFVTYSNESKTRLLGVPADLIERWGAVSPQVADAMAQGACERGGADIAVAVTGVAGPGGGSIDKPVGLVYLSGRSLSGTSIRWERRYGDLGRSQVRSKTVSDALELLRDVLSSIVDSN